MNSRLGTSYGHLLRHKSRGGTWCLSPELSPAGSGYLLTTTATVGHKNHGVSTLPFGVPRGSKGLRCLVTSVNVHCGGFLVQQTGLWHFLRSLLCLGKLQEGRQRGLEDSSDRASQAFIFHAALR